MKSAVSFKSVLFRGLAATLLGVLSVFIPGFSIVTLIIIIGIAVALAGITSFFFRYRNPHKNYAINFLHIAGSVINLIFGLILIIMPESFEEVFIIVSGIVIITGGIVMLFNSIITSPLTKNAKIFLAISVLIIILGVLFLIDIFEKNTSRILFFGIIAFFYGITNIIMSFWIRNFIEKNKELSAINKNIEDVDYETVNNEKESE